MQIDLLRAADLDAALALSTAEGWNQTAADWRRLVDLEPMGCFAAREGDRLIGTVTTTTYGTALAWIGMMIVLPEVRGRGIGAALMKTALDHLHGLGVATVKLDATPAGRPLYASLGFTEEASFERWQGVATAGQDSLRSTERSTPERLHELDRAAYDVDRARLVNLLIEACVGEPIVVASAEGAGFVLARRGRTAAYVGPLIAMTVSVVGPLLNGILARLAGEEVCLDLHRAGRMDPELLARRGLTKQRELTRMVHGRPSAGGTSPMICASAGPEFG